MRVPVNVGITGVKPSQLIFAAFFCASSKRNSCFTERLLPKSSFSLSYSFLSTDKNSGFCSLLNKLPATVTLRLASKTCTTPLSYSGAIFTAVCILLVVAPPISSGISIPSRFISLPMYTISSNEGVINPLSPMMSTWCFFASVKIFSAGTITPKSMMS